MVREALLWGSSGQVRWCTFVLSRLVLNSTATRLVLTLVVTRLVLTSCHPLSLSHCNIAHSESFSGISSISSISAVVDNSCAWEHSSERGAGMKTFSTCTLAGIRSSERLHDEVRKCGDCGQVGTLFGGVGPLL